MINPLRCKFRYRGYLPPSLPPSPPPPSFADMAEHRLGCQGIHFTSLEDIHSPSFSPLVTLFHVGLVFSPCSRSRRSSITHTSRRISSSLFLRIPFFLSLFPFPPVQEQRQTVGSGVSNFYVLVKMQANQSILSFMANDS